MTTIITRLYADRARADEVVAGLQRWGFGELDYDVIAREGVPPDGMEEPAETAAHGADDALAGGADAGTGAHADADADADGQASAEAGEGDAPAAKPSRKRAAAPVPARADTAEREALARRMLAARVPAASAAACLDRVAEGNVLVVVRAPFGFAVRAETVLDAAPAVDAPAARRRRYVPPRGSGRLNDGPIPSLLPPGSLFMTGPVSGSVIRRPEPFESSFGFPLLIRPFKPDRMRIPEKPPFASVFPFPTLIHRKPGEQRARPMPTASERIGIPLLLDRRPWGAGRQAS